MEQASAEPPQQSDLPLDHFQPYALWLCRQERRRTQYYVSQEKLVPQTSWAPIALEPTTGTAATAKNTLKNFYATSFHYVEFRSMAIRLKFDDICPVINRSHSMAHGHTIDRQVQADAVWLVALIPAICDQSSLEVAKAFNSAAGRSLNCQECRGQIEGEEASFAVEDPDSPKCFPRLFTYLARKLLLSSAKKPPEYFLKHYLGTHTNLIT
ncbi:MAG: hypothetical protein IPK53_12380 [bacterium]|nr:hypothetical protein [bacterium]